MTDNPWRSPSGDDEYTRHPEQPTAPHPPAGPAGPGFPPAGPPVSGGTNPFQHTGVAPGYDPTRMYGEPEQRTFLQRVSNGPGWGILAGLIWTSVMTYLFLYEETTAGWLGFLAAILAPPIVLLFVHGWRRFALGWLIVFALSPIILAGVCIAFITGVSS